MPVVDVTIKYLEMNSPGELRPKRASRAGVTVTRVPQPFPELNRFFYAAVGAEYSWVDRLSWPISKWREYLDRPDIETWVMAVTWTLHGVRNNKPFAAKSSASLSRS